MRDHPDDEFEVILQTARREEVARVGLPYLDPWPDVILWAGRAFVHKSPLDVRSGKLVYTEGAVWRSPADEAPEVFEESIVLAEPAGGVEILDGIFLVRTFVIEPPEGGVVGLDVELDGEG
jgi:hypothetical protein